MQPGGRGVAFQSTLPARGSDEQDDANQNRHRQVSIHAPREGERPAREGAEAAQTAFQSTLPARGSDQACNITVLVAWHVSIHAPREGERRPTVRNLAGVQPVSIHAPREGERPIDLLTPLAVGREFQSTLPARGSDTFVTFAPSNQAQFQSTLPARGSDSGRLRRFPTGRCFNPRSPRGGATEPALNPA